jgi:phosphatidylserine synthase
MVGLVLFIFLFPEGRLAFPWVRWLAAPLVVTVVLYVLRAPLGISDLWISEAGWGTLMAALLTLWLGGLAVQAYRYPRLASAEARQQIKWVLLGLSAPVT